jgi:hypothetical protein
MIYYLFFLARELNLELKIYGMVDVYCVNYTIILNIFKNFIMNVLIPVHRLRNIPVCIR